MVAAAMLGPSCCGGGAGGGKEGREGWRRPSWPRPPWAGRPTPVLSRMGSMVWKWCLPAVGEEGVGDERGRVRQAPMVAPPVPGAAVRVAVPPTRVGVVVGPNL